jgi:hypothetical protein
MASYQLSEKNQILVALFAVVVVCAGKLFKDYLFRRGYVEGMTVTTTTNKQLRRNAAGGTNLVAELYLDSTLDRDLTTSHNIQLSWTGNTAASAVDVTTGTNFGSGGDYTASVVSGTTSTTLTPSGSGSPITFTPSANIMAGSKIRITVKNVTIYPGTKSDSTLTFKVKPSNSESEVSREFKIFPALSDGQNQFVSSSSATTEEIQAAINDINTRLSTGGITMPVTERTNLLKARSALVTLLASTYGTIQEAGQVFDSKALYEAQKTAIQFIKSEKERAAANANALKQDNSNKRRMAQINTYYTKNYEANTEVMKNIIFVSIALIILAVLRTKDLIPASISTLGVIFVLTLGGIVIGKQVFDIIRRNDHDFDKYDWNFNEDEMNRKQLLQQNSDPANLSDMGLGMAPCYGPGCCDVGTTWNADAKKCIPSIPGLSGTAVWTTSASGATSLTLSLKVTNALSADETITITLPSGLFSGSSLALSGSNFSVDSGSAISTSAPFILKITAAGVSAYVQGTKTLPNIVITGLSVIPSDSSTRSKQLKVKSSKDVNEVGINITGIP